MAARRSSGSSPRYSATVFALLCTTRSSFHQITRQPFRFEDLDVRLFGDGQEVVDDVPFHQTAIAPVVRQPDLMHELAVDLERGHTRGDEGARFDRSAGRGN